MMDMQSDPRNFEYDCHQYSYLCYTEATKCDVVSFSHS